MTNVEKSLRLSKLAREFNVGISTIVEFLHKKGHKIPSDPNSKVDAELYNLLAKEYGAEVNLKMESQKVSLKSLRDKKETVSIEDVEKEAVEEVDVPDSDDEEFIKNILSTPKQKEAPAFEKPKIDLKLKGKIDLDALSPKKQQPAPTPKAPEVKTKQEPEATKPAPKKEEKPVVAEHKVEKKPEHISTSPVHVEQPKVVGKVDLTQLNQKTRPTHKNEQHPKQEQQHPKQEQQQHSKHEQHPKQKPKQHQPEQDKGQHKVHKPVKEVEKPAPVENIVETSVEIQEQVKVEPQEAVLFRREVEKLSGPTVVGKINLEAFEVKKKQPVASSSNNDTEKSNKKKRRKRIRKDNQKVNISAQGQGNQGGSGTPGASGTSGSTTLKYSPSANQTSRYACKEGCIG